MLLWISEVYSRWSPFWLSKSQLFRDINYFNKIPSLLLYEVIQPWEWYPIAFMIIYWLQECYRSCLYSRLGDYKKAWIQVDENPEGKLWVLLALAHHLMYYLCLTRACCLLRHPTKTIKSTDITKLIEREEMWETNAENYLASGRMEGRWLLCNG